MLRLYPDSPTLRTSRDLRAADLFVENAAGIGEYTASGTVINASLIPGDNSYLVASSSDLFVGVAFANSDGEHYSIGEYTTRGAVVNASLIAGLTSFPTFCAGSDPHTHTHANSDGVDTASDSDHQYRSHLERERQSAGERDDSFVRVRHGLNAFLRHEDDVGTVDW